MASLNLCQFIGHIGKIENRYMSNGDAVVNCSVAVNESYKDKNGEKQEKTEWINVIAYRKLAEIMATYCTKGMPIYVSGKIATRKWEDKNGVERYSTEIIANDMKMLGFAREKVNSDDRQFDESNSPRKQPTQKHSTAQTGTGFDDMDDDIPF
ncbi:MAG: single-stranded DNA-binding protein [Nitrosomonas sp.]|jgi:single-strand DNA-binding protein|nr:single-stranded DNA-binding protein [Nitrosomonas sp.]